MPTTEHTDAPGLEAAADGCERLEFCGVVRHLHHRVLNDDGVLGESALAKEGAVDLLAVRTADARFVTDGDAALPAKVDRGEPFACRRVSSLSKNSGREGILPWRVNNMGSSESNMPHRRVNEGNAPCRACTPSSS